MILLGASSAPTPANAYQSYNFPRLLPLLLNEPRSIDAVLQTTRVGFSPASRVVYLDTIRDTELLVFQTNSCSIASEIDYLYENDYMNIVLNAAFAGHGGWNASQSWILVDCSFDGQIIGDTTVIKITTFMLQTLSILRPEKHLESSGGAAMWTTTMLKSLQITSGDVVICSESANYSVAIGFDFPFENTDFVPILLDNFEPQDGKWVGRVMSTKEKLQFAGTSGVFRESPTIQAFFSNFYWQLPANSMDFISTIQFVAVQKNKDSWAWLRCVLCDGIWINIAINFGVALTVMVNMYRKHNIIWIPDVYASLQDRAAIRAGLLLFDSLLNGWWYPYQWASIKAISAIQGAH
ncbi:hypothetical protein AC1031_005662 [Aphanomyces cochlioides]|nr:hypothetical protein AC1031_005662 [Aphanomyces cochlioides]